MLSFSSKRWLGAWCLVFGSLPAQASPVLAVDLIPSLSKLHQGEVLYISAQLSGLRTAGLNAVVGAFSLEVSYDPTHVQNANVGPVAGFGADLGDPSLGEAVTFADFSTPGLLRIAETSLLDELALTGLQSDRIVLATFGFTLRPNAASDFETWTVTGFSVADAFASPILDDQGNPVPVLTGSTTLAVPAPASIWLLGIALPIGLACGRRRHLPRPLAVPCCQ